MDSPDEVLDEVVHGDEGSLAEVGGREVAKWGRRGHHEGAGHVSTRATVGQATGHHNTDNTHLRQYRALDCIDQSDASDLRRVARRRPHASRTTHSTHKIYNLD